MSIKENMKFGTSGMTEGQKGEEMARRLKVIEKVNNLGFLMVGADEKKRKAITRKLNRIKADESVWLREAAWFMYA